MSSTDGPFIPMVSSSPPPMDDGGFDEDDEDFGSFSHYGSDLVGSPPSRKKGKETKPDVHLNPVNDSNIQNGNGDQFQSFTKVNAVDDNFADFTDASNGNSRHAETSENSLPHLTNGNTTHLNDCQNKSNEAQSISSLSGGTKQTLDLFSEFHSSNDVKDNISKDSTSISSMDDDFSDFSAFTSGAVSGLSPDNEEVPSSRNDKDFGLRSKNSDNCHTKLKNLRDDNELSDVVSNSDSESAMTLRDGRTDTKCNAFQNNNTLKDHDKLTNDDGFADFNFTRCIKTDPQETLDNMDSSESPLDGKAVTSIEIESKIADSQTQDKSILEQDDFSSFSDSKLPEVEETKSEIVIKDSFGANDSKPATDSNDLDDFGDFDSKPAKNDFGDFNSKPTKELDDFGEFDFKRGNNLDEFDSKLANNSDDFSDFDSRPMNNDFGDFDSKPVSSYQDFGNFNSETTSSGGFGNFKSKTTTSGEFGNFAEFKKEESEVQNKLKTVNDDEFAEDFQSFQKSSKSDDKFADFGSFESTKASDDDSFGTFHESTTSKSGTFSQINQNDDDDDFGDFGSFSNSKTSDDFGKFATGTVQSEPAQQTAQIPKVSGSKLEQLFRVCFPSSQSNVEADNTINLLLDVVRKETKERDKKKTNGSANIWDHLQNMEKTNALMYQWADSNNNKQLLAALAIDTRNILSSKKRPTPIFASDLGLLIPSKAGEKVEKLQESSPEETLVSTTAPNVVPDEEASAKLEFDWSGSGLTNPLDANSLNLDFFVVETKSSFKSNRGKLAGGLDSDFLGLEMSVPLAPPPGATSIKPLDNILKNMQTSMVTQPKKDENLSQEANNVLSNLPHLSFMHAKVLMFPMHPATDESSM